MLQKAFVVGQAGGNALAEAQCEAPAKTSRPPSLVALPAVISIDPSPVAPVTV